MTISIKVKLKLPALQMPNKRSIKVCATCGKAEGKHWARHWKQ